VKEDNWQTVSSERHFANAHLEVVTDHVQTPSQSQPLTWTIVHRKAAVIIAPMTRDGKIVLIRQERIPIRQSIWEMPSGQIDFVAGGADLGFAKRPATSWPKTASSSRWVITFHRRDSRMSGATSFWRVRSCRARIMCATNRNRFWIAVRSRFPKFTA